MRKILTIAGSDSIGGAGIQADLKTFCALGVYGMSVITAVTAQNTRGVFDVRNMDESIIKEQIDCVFDDTDVDALKIGMVSTGSIIEVIASSLKKWKAQNIVLDPVMISKSGYYLLKTDAINVLKTKLMPLADILTPNIPEAELITGIKINGIDEMKKAAKMMVDMGANTVVVKGGHLINDAADVFYDGKELFIMPEDKINTKNTHGTGCTYSAAIASYLGKGFSEKEAVLNAKRYITTAIKNSLSIGKGVGPLGHLIDLYRRAGVDY
ncbi:bifunctional hydroxymethylpyrimidine kinase/phosphomethylpyrimidine kinase [Aceticella autotrophica]|uniref:Hydroxymethylpyrimidine/phosphomethylpyrimidine kinase n=1 Tax=Aceticella autotrophica TaxID=2755338 RepID=A0A975AWS7_9THEO|nr:bifunctional hydroxymethylpyrimidine kinase/phosphomethylpyrimidine kinase [Aceticella autotrophica]QSZ27828.1 bifunctional hydroxymethylpyrimidine kinase/phosphomethylpyrimidine kinase [Aceticella autotrophica]